MKDVSGLSAVRFVKNNKRKVSVIIVALTICIMALYIVNFMLQSIKETFKPLCFEQPKKVIFLQLSVGALGIDASSYTQDELDEKVNEARERAKEAMEAMPGVKKVYFSQCINSVMNACVGQYWYEQPLLEASEIPGYIEHINAKLINGRFPEDNGEIVLDSVVMKNNGFSVGDYFMPEYWNKGFKIVGEIESDCYALCGTTSGYMNSGWYFIIEHDGSIKDMKKMLEEAGYMTDSSDTVDDAVRMKAMYQKEVVDIVDSVIKYFFYGATFLISFAVLIVFISFIRDRQGEWCLYRSLGYSREEIYRMIMSELGIMFLIAGGITIVTTYLAMIFMKKLMMEPKGLVCAFWYPESLLMIIAALCLVIGILQIPIAYTINKIKTVDKMED